MDIDSPIYQEIKSYDKEIMHFDRHDDNINFVPMHIAKPSEDGTYLTLRCGYCGISQVLNVWKNDMWQMNCTDGSTTIAYSRKPIILKNKW